MNATRTAYNAARTRFCARCGERIHLATIDCRTAVWEHLRRNDCNDPIPAPRAGVTRSQARGRLILLAGALIWLIGMIALGEPTQILP